MSCCNAFLTIQQHSLFGQGVCGVAWSVFTTAVAFFEHIIISWTSQRVKWLPTWTDSSENTKKSVFSTDISGSFILFRVLLLAAFQQNSQSSEKENSLVSNSFLYKPNYIKLTLLFLIFDLSHVPIITLIRIIGLLCACM